MQDSGKLDKELGDPCAPPNLLGVSTPVCYAWVKGLLTFPRVPFGMGMPLACLWLSALLSLGARE